ncbi:MAG: ankyrin repeat domain-containing protein [Tahibacter sp.]
MSPSTFDRDAKRYSGHPVKGCARWLGSIALSGRQVVASVVMLLSISVAVAAPPSHREALKQLSVMGIEANTVRLIQYAGEGDRATVDLLLAAGVSPEAADPLRKVTPLHNASAQGHAGLVTRFLELGAKVDAQDWKGYTPLIDAAYQGHADVVTLLLARNARIDVRPPDGPTALIAAVQYGSAPVVLQLLNSGADPMLADAAGRTPIAAAELAGRAELAAMLKAAMGAR